MGGGLHSPRIDAHRRSGCPWRIGTLSIMDVIAAIGQCSTAPDVADFDPIWRWEGKLQRAADNSTIFGKTTNLYVNDRCFVPRRVCKVHVKETGATLLLPRDGPANVDLRSRQFDVVIGAAQVMGVVARTNFASLLEQAGGLPIVNLGKGAAGPHAYTDASNWRHLAPLFANARAVIICVMAGRSSSNSATGAFSGQSFGSEQIRAFDEVNGLLRSEGAEPRRRGERLRRESLETARSDYTELVRRIRAGSTSPGGYARPRVLLTWFSSCPIGGCAELWQYPQYFLAGTGSSSNVLTFLAPSLDGAEMVDLSYGHLPPSPPIAIDQCASCGTGAPTSERRVCSSPEFRQDALQHGRTCSSKCSAVRDRYAPRPDRYAPRPDHTPFHSVSISQLRTPCRASARRCATLTTPTTPRTSTPTASSRACSERRLTCTRCGRRRGRRRSLRSRLRGERQRSAAARLLSPSAWTRSSSSRTSTRWRAPH